MKLNLYSVHDRMMGVYLAPFVARNDVEAVRQLKAAFEDPQMSKTPMVSNPEHFNLVQVGEFNDESGGLNDRDHAVHDFPAVVTPLTSLRTVFP
ncbi:MAG: nonstructural protein [Arizlama microvirus]|nr:MAG: nonstructural protein [Arizlama microvirus]